MRNGMPGILELEGYAQSLGPKNANAQGPPGMLQLIDSARLPMHPVSPQVHRPENNGSELLGAVEAEQ